MNQIARIRKRKDLRLNLILVFWLEPVSSKCTGILCTLFLEGASSLRQGEGMINWRAGAAVP